MGAIKINGETSGSTTITAPDTGSDETIELSTVLAAKAPSASPTFTGTVALPSTTTLGGSTLTSGKILQIVRATDTTLRSTTSTTFVDASISVTITPKSASSAILIVWSHRAQAESTTDNTYVNMQITDSSNNAISGAEENATGTVNITGIGTRVAGTHITLVGYDTPATISPVTYKGRFKKSTAGGTALIYNNDITGQMYAIEVSA